MGRRLTISMYKENCWNGAGFFVHRNDVSGLESTVCY